MKVLHIFKKKFLVPTLILSGVLGLATTLTDDFEIAKNLEIYSNIYRDLNIYYVDEIDPEKLMETGLEAMLNSLDPYTTYIPAEEVEQFRSSITGHYGGMGATITSEGDYVIITELYEQAPAHKTGLRPGDKLIAANGQSLKGKNVKEISTIMRGKPGTVVKAEVQRPGVKESLFFEIKREEVNVNNLPHYEVLDGDIGYIALTTFTENAGKNVHSALMELKNKKQLKGIVLDLRGNSGGLLAEAVNVVNVFVNKGEEVVSIKGKEKDKQQIFKTLHNPVDTELPLVVLIDANSASASEIVAGAIQDLDRGVIVGAKSYGKGLVQNTRDLPFGAKLKITTARYYIPSGRCIQSLQYKDGQSKAIADSLREAFKTKNGRVVYDGGGVAPDLALQQDDFKKILNSLNQQRLIFDYAVDYRTRHDAIAAAKDFKLNEEDYKDFIGFLERRNYSYVTETERALINLEQKASDENYAEALNSQIEEMKEILKKGKSDMLEGFKKELLFELQRNICLNYHLERGALQNATKYDPAVLKSTELLNATNDYKAILKR